MSESVTSEVNSFLLYKRDFKRSAITSYDQNYENICFAVSVFRFSRPAWWNDENERILKTSKPDPQSGSVVVEDDDGDLDVPRGGGDQYSEDLYLEIEHRLNSTLLEVGMQIWRGSLVISDYLIQEHENFRSKVVLEIGSGVGLVAIVASVCGVNKIFATDLDFVTSLMKKNFARNLFDDVENFEVKTLDVKAFNDCQDFNNVDIVLGADVIYDFDLSDGVIAAMRKLICCPPFKPKTFLFSVEKRFIFSVNTLDTVAPAFDFFITLLEDLKSNLFSTEKIFLAIDFVPLETITQSFCYERSKDLTLIKIVSSENDCI